MVNIDSSEMTKPGLKVDISIKMDLEQFINELIEISKAYKIDGNYSEWLKKCGKIKEDLPIILPSFARNPINSYYFVECLNKYSKYNVIYL